MKDSKLNKLFEAARNERAPEVPFGFAGRVAAAVTHRSGRDTEAPSTFDALSQLFPRFALAAVLVIAGCVATEWYFAEKEAPLEVSVEQVSNEWIYAAK